MTFECLDRLQNPEFRLLDGRTVEGTVGLAPSGDPSPSGTRWEVTMIAQGVVTLKCLGVVEGPQRLRFLDGRTLDGTVALAPRTTPPFIGTRWAMVELPDDVVTLRCLGELEGPEGRRFLDGRTGDRSVGLAPAADEGFSGTFWRVRALAQLVTLQCLGEAAGARFLDGRTQDATVGLAPTTAAPASGTLWEMSGTDEVTLRCLGEVEGARFLDGRTLTGAVGLAPSSEPAFSGTRWEKIDLAPGVIALRCLGEAEGPENRRFLDGRTGDGTVGLALSTTPPFSGTRWRVGMPSAVLGDGDIASEDILAVHAALLPTGEIISFGGDEHDHDQHHSGATNRTRLFTCANARIRDPGSPTSDLFCCGHAMLADGRLLVAGGTELFVQSVAHPHFGGLHDASVFDPFAGQWFPVAPMTASGPLEEFRAGPLPGGPGGRWYPMLVTLGSGDVLTVSGHPSGHDSRHNHHVAERFSPTPAPLGTWTLLWPPSPDFESTAAHVYPRLHLLPNGKVFCSTPLAAPARSQSIDPATGARSAAGDPPPDGINVGGEFVQDGTSVLLPLLPSDAYRPRVLLCGGHQPVVADLQPLLDDPDARAHWVPTAPRHLAAAPPRFGAPNPERFHLNAVLLPTGQVLISGGCADFRRDNAAVLESELYQPAEGDQPDQWETLPAATVTRNYHSVAVLMPDGRVWTAGSNHDGMQGRDTLEARIEIINPPYMSARVRPAITSVEDRMPYGASVRVATPQARSIGRVVILRAASVTHSFTSDQRYVGLNFAVVSDGQLDVEGPPNANIAPPGFYLLFVLDEAGIPSTGHFLQVGAS